MDIHTIHINDTKNMELAVILLKLKHNPVQKPKQTNQPKKPKKPRGPVPYGKTYVNNVICDHPSEKHVLKFIKKYSEMNHEEMANYLNNLGIYHRNKLWQPISIRSLRKRPY